jgi:cyclohexanone monooxygenase
VLRIVEDVAAQGTTASVEPTPDAEASWVTHVNEVVAGTLLPRANSWWMGANIPGKPRQVVAYAAGFPAYRSHAEEGLDGLQNYVVTAAR